MIYYTLELSQRSNDLREVEFNRHLMIQKADELRQSSDDLTRFCRTYVVSADTNYRDKYFKVLDIRNGKIARPKNYEHIYWDLLEPIRKNRHPDEKKTSIHGEMSLLPYTKYEFQKLKEAENNSNNLVYMEIEAFNAMDGLFKDKDGEYTIKGEKNQSLAIALLHSTPYHEAKEKIMLPIDEFLSSLTERTKKEVKFLNREIKLLFEKIFILFALGALTLASTFFIIVKKVLQPIDALTKAILSFKHGNGDIEKMEHYDDEIGIMADQFFMMKNKLDDDYKEIKKLALTDPLTQIRNRRSFFEMAKHYLKLAHREDELFSLIMFDIDFFKKINDTYGHLVGDEILKFL
ncbi:MAG TPA: sensor domain-containing diguanylate cyclase, partial [Candidatus Dadabacteria bacterium]|nr:sensor domain-containing diguanylate cyclase [Candidatus Dadabacteria bacterium]